MSDVRVRFAPSPTGPLHMGGVRTALYNYLFARKHGGTFILRIEDTDQTRFVPGAEAYIEESLAWLGIAPDESASAGGDFGPYRQSERKERYRGFADALVIKGHAYIAFDSPEAIDAKRTANEQGGLPPWQYDHTTRGEMENSLSLSSEEVQTRMDRGDAYVIRFKIPADREVTFTDMVRGEVTYPTKVLDDKVLFKSDGMPTYHLANVVDDHEMAISHVIRGEEWLPSAPLHVLLYEAFGWDRPTFAHLPLILKPSGPGKLSKRDGDKFGFPVFPLEWTDPKTGDLSRGFREDGYLPSAFLNMLLMLGWNPGDERELFTLEEMTAAFGIDRVQKAGARFSPDKAKWFNEQYLRALTPDALAAAVAPWTEGRGLTPEQVLGACALMAERSTLLPDLLGAAYLFAPPATYDEKTVRKKWKEHSPGIVADLRARFAALDAFDEASVDAAFKGYMEEKELGFGQVGPALRLVLTGLGGGPSIPAIAAFLGREEVLARMDAGLQNLGA